VVHNGAPFPELFYAAESRPSDIIFPSGDQLMKGAYDVMNMWPRLLERGFMGRLHWFGEVGPRHAAEIGQLPGGEAIILHGRVARSQIFRQASFARVLLMLSRAESFGVTNSLKIVCRCPVGRGYYPAHLS
jgi:hypothetical protein